MRLRSPGLLAIAAAVLAAALFVPAAPSQAAPESPPQLLEPDRFLLGRIVEVIGERDAEGLGEQQFVQQVLVRVAGTSDLGQDVQAEFTDMGAEPDRRLAEGDRVVIAVSEDPGGTTYYVIDRYRLPALGFAVGLFFALAILFSRRRGLGSIIGLGITALVLARFVVPAIVAGSNPLGVSLVGALVIVLTSIYLAHGFSVRTSVAVVSTIVTLVIAWALAITFVSLARLTGMGSEESVYLQFAPLEQLNLRGLLLGGIILGPLGVLDDITTSQAAAVDELRKANPAFPVRELYRRGLSIGTEHITSLVNTLFLAYAGASLPLFILFTIYNDAPAWVTLNSEFVAEELVRTLVGSVALILAVPITTLSAAAVFSRRPATAPEGAGPGHGHRH